MKRAITQYQRQEQRYTMDWERFVDRLVFILAMVAIVWMIMP